jgi:hypothetical protein
MGDEGSWVVLISAIILISFTLLFALFWLGWRMTQRSHSVSPYTGIPLRRTSEISYYSAEKILRFVHEFRQYDNRIFKLNRASFCRETGRIFQDSVTWLDIINVNWTFLQKRYPGHYVSWGSLSKELQDVIRLSHTSLEGFQTDRSSPSPSPRAIESEYVYTKPGPLYVDLETKTLLGWKQVPGTEFEVLIVQKPKTGS